MKYLLLATLAVSSVACSPQSMLQAEAAKPNPAPPSTTCPPPGTSVPFAQLWGQASSFNGCDVTSEIAFHSTSQVCPSHTPKNPGDTCFLVTPPNQKSPHYMKVGKDFSGPLFSAATGALFQVRGTILVDQDFGVIAFAASGVQPVASAPAVGSASTSSGTSP